MAGKKGDPPADPKDSKTPPADPPKADPPAGDPPAGDPPAEPAKKQEKTYSKAELQSEVQKAIAAEKKKWDDEKDLTELDRIKKENEDLRAANRLRDAKDSVVDALTKAGARSTELLWKAIKDDLEFDDKGNLKNLDTLVTTIKTDYADQFGEPKPSETIDGGAGGGEGTKGKLTKEALAKMSPAEIQKLDWETEVKPVMEAK